jgi:hypothetical protein
MVSKADLSKDGVSTVVGAVLLLALLITVIAAAKVVYVPDMKQQAEADHMDSVVQDIMDHKARLDEAAFASNLTSPDQSVYVSSGAFVSTNIEMGGGSIPVVGPSPSSGTLKVDPDYGQLTITAGYRADVPPDNANLTPLKGEMGSFSYSSANSYRPDQKYHFEDGMVIMSQYDGRSVIAGPAIAVNGYPDQLRLMISSIRIDGKPTSVSSSGQEILTSALYADHVIHDVKSNGICNVTINVTTDYPEEWCDFFVKEFTAAGLPPDTDSGAAPGYNVTASGPKVTARLWSGPGKIIVVDYTDADFVTTIGDQVIPPVSYQPAPYASPTPSPSPSPSPSPTPSPSPVPNCLYLRPTLQLKTAPNPSDGSTTLQPFLLLFPDTAEWVQTPAMNGSYTLQGPISVYLYENDDGLLGLIQYQTVTLYKQDASGHQKKIGSTSSFGTLLSVPGTGVSIVPATFNPSGGSVSMAAGDRLVLEVSYGGLLNLNAITIRESPAFTSRVEVVNTLPP